MGMIIGWRAMLLFEYCKVLRFICTGNKITKYVPDHIVGLDLMWG